MDRILIVDSSIENTDLMRECLGETDYEIITAESGLNALAKVNLFEPDLVILDTDLQDMSGYEVCKTIKDSKETQYILVLVVSLSESSEARIRSIEVGADDFMEKTFDAFLLISKTKALLRLKYLSDELKQKILEIEEKNSILEFQLKMGRQVQRSILPHIDMTFNDISFLSKYEPAMDIGGDFYDVLVLDNRYVSVILGDVSGHGIGAALLTSMLSMMGKNAAKKHPKPEDFLFSINNEFCYIFENGTIEMYASVFYALIDTEKKEIMFANAGQALPIFVDSDKNEAAELESSGLPIGFLKNSKYEQSLLKYSSGDVLLFHTDGLSDTFYKESPEDFSNKMRELLLDAKSLENPKDIIDMVLGSFYAYNVSENEKLELDDVSILLCKMR